VARVVLDTNIFLCVINREEPLYQPSKSLLDGIDGGEAAGIVSTITIAELSVGYHMAGDIRGKNQLLMHLTSSPHYEVHPVDASIADLAGMIRADTGLRLPDALIMATGVRANAHLVATYDEELRKAKEHITVKTPTEIHSP